MRNLSILNENGKLVAHSREVAELLGVEHNQLLRKIRTYVKYLTCAKMHWMDFFLVTNYKDAKGETRPCYLLSKKGCDLVANKITGAKGVIFTATYVTKFEEMESTINNAFVTAELRPELQMFKQIFDSVVSSELEQKRLSKEFKEAREEFAALREVIEIAPSKQWRRETNTLLKKICFKVQDYQHPKEEIYKALQARASCDLKRRLENLRARFILNGGSKSKAEALNYLDVISEDKRLIEIYTTIVKETAVRHSVAQKGDKLWIN